MKVKLTGFGALFLYPFLIGMWLSGNAIKLLMVIGYLYIIMLVVDYVRASNDSKSNKLDKKKKGNLPPELAEKLARREANT